MDLNQTIYCVVRYYATGENELVAAFHTGIATAAEFVARANAKLHIPEGITPYRYELRKRCTMSTLWDLVTDDDATTLLPV